MTTTPVLLPMLNANEPEARIVDVHAAAGKLVKKGELLFTIETTKAAADVDAPEDGFFRPVRHAGETLAVGQVLAFITSEPDDIIDEPRAADPGSTEPQKKNTALTPSAVRITSPARALAESLGIDLAGLPTDRLITEAVLRSLAGQAAAPQKALRSSTAGMVIYGAGGHAKAVLEMAKLIGSFPIVGIIDDNAALTGSTVLGVSVLGTRDALPGLVERGIGLAANGVGGIIDIGIRVKLFNLLADFGFAFPVLRHPHATVEASALIEDGVQVFANAYVGSSALLHTRCMVNTGAIISHDCVIGSYSHIAPGALLAGHVHVGEKALVGMGVTTAIGISIGNGARVGNGAILLADVPDRAIIPAGKVWSK